MLSYSIYLLSNIFKVYILLRFHEHFFTPKDLPKWLRYLFFGIYFLINSLTYIIFDNNYLNLITNIVPLYCITYLYSLKWQERIFFPISIFVVMLCIESLICNIFITIVHYNSIAGLSVITNLTMLLVERFFESRNLTIVHSYNINRLHFIAIILVVMSSIAIAVVTMTNYNTHIIIITIALFLINLVIFSLYDMISKIQQELYEKKIIEQQNKAYNNQIKLWESNRSATRILKHDMKNHIISIQMSLENGNYQEVEEYITQMKKSLDIKDEFIKTGNLSADSIINYKLKEIKNLTENITYNINLPNTLFISDFDFNIILGNLLDNSIEALSKCNKNDSSFDCKIEYTHGILKIFISNTYIGTLNKKENSFKTTKQDTNLHGIGLESVKNTIAKYNSILKFNNDGNIFKVNVVLCSDDVKL